MQGCSTPSQWEAPAPALPWFDTGPCRGTELLPALPGGWGQTLWSLCDPLEHKDVPVTLLARARCTEGNLDLQTPSAGCPGPPTALPTHNPPARAGLLCKLAAQPDKAPYQARRAERGGRGGPGGARARLRAGGGRAEVPGSIPAPAGLRPDTRHGSAPTLAGLCQTARGREAHPAPALPRPRRRFLSLRPACAQAPAGEKRLRKEMEKARLSWQVESRRGRGHLRPGAGCRGAPGGPHLAGVPGCAATAGLLYFTVRGN